MAAWLGEEFPEIGVWSLGYAASPTRWSRLLRLVGRGSRDSGHSMALPDRALQVAFADSESEIAVTIELGMSIDEVIKAKGNPKTRVDLGSKVILTYDDLKFTFSGWQAG